MWRLSQRVQTIVYAVCWCPQYRIILCDVCQCLETCLVTIQHDVTLVVHLVWDQSERTASQHHKLLMWWIQILNGKSEQHSLGFVLFRRSVEVGTCLVFVCGAVFTSRNFACALDMSRYHFWWCMCSQLCFSCIHIINKVSLSMAVVEHQAGLMTKFVWYRHRCRLVNGRPSFCACYSWEGSEHSTMYAVSILFYDVELVSGMMVFGWWFVSWSSSGVCDEMTLCLLNFPLCGTHTHELWITDHAYWWQEASEQLSSSKDQGSISSTQQLTYVRWSPNHERVCFCCNWILSKLSHDLMVLSKYAAQNKQAQHCLYTDFEPKKSKQHKVCVLLENSMWV